MSKRVLTFEQNFSKIQLDRSIMLLAAYYIIAILTKLFTVLYCRRI